MKSSTRSGSVPTTSGSPIVADPPAPAAGGSGPLWGALAVLVVARAVCSLAPTMFGWGLNTQRFLSPALGWGLWALSAVALMPFALVRGGPATVAAGGWLVRSRLAPAVVAIAAALLAWSLPDRLYFVGDFLIRLGAMSNAISNATLFPQAMPLDLAIHHDLTGLLAALGLDPLLTERLLGAGELAALAALAIAFARVLGLSGPAALAAVASVWMGGYLGLFTGYGKAFRELCVIVAAVGVFGVRFARTGREAWPLGLSVVAGLAVHRAGIVLLVPYAVALALGLRSTAAARRRGTGVAIAVTFAALAALVPMTLGRVRAADAGHLGPGGTRPLEVLGAALAPSHLLDAMNLVLLLAPLALVGLVLFLSRGRAVLATREAVVLGALALPFAAGMVFTHARQGSFRDWDVYAPGAVALAMLSASAIAHAIPTAGPRAGLGLAAALAVAVPGVQGLALGHDLDAGLARVRAYVSEPPARTEGDRALAWDFVGARMGMLDSLDASADAYARAASITPTPRLLYTWAKAEAAREHYDVARKVLIQLTAKADTWADAWAASAFVAQQLGDTLEARAAANRALELNPDDAMARDVLRAVAGKN